MRKIAPRLRMNLEATDVGYTVRRHRPTATASETAEAAHVPGRKLVKSVLLGGDGAPVLAVLSSTQHVDLARINEALGRKLDLVPEADIRNVFFDCAVGALPPTGATYGVEEVMDPALDDLDEVYVEAGDHRHVLRLDGADFVRLMRNARRVPFAVAGPVAAAEPAPADAAAEGDGTATEEPPAKPKRAAARKAAADPASGATDGEAKPA